MEYPQRTTTRLYAWTLTTLDPRVEVCCDVWRGAMALGMPLHGCNDFVFLSLSQLLDTHTLAWHMHVYSGE